MKTRITELLGIQHPIIQAAMGLVADAALVSAVCNAGGLGILASLLESPEAMRKEIHRIRELTGGKRFGVNLVPMRPGFKRYLDLFIEEQVPVWNSGLRSPFSLASIKKPENVIYIATVGNARQALRAQRDGADAVIVQGWEGGGHTGTIASTVLIPSVVKAVSIPVIAAGGFCDGRGLVAALALGAEGISMGTRFAVTQESSLAPQIKQKYLQVTSERDIKVSAVYDGLDLRVLLGEKMEGYRGWWTRPWEVLPRFLSAKRAYQADLRQMIEVARTVRAMGMPIFQYLCGMEMERQALREGRLERTVMPSGQVAIRVKDIPTCREVIERTVTEAEQVIKDLRLKLALS